MATTQRVFHQAEGRHPSVTDEAPSAFWSVTLDAIFPHSSQDHHPSGSSNAPGIPVAVGPAATASFPAGMT